MIHTIIPIKKFQINRNSAAQTKTKAPNETKTKKKSGT
jgi:hypothetical protein